MSNQILTYNDRIQIEKYIHEGMTYRKMGKLLNINFSTIWRKIARNGGRKNYDPYKADISTFHHSNLDKPLISTINRKS